MKKQLILMLLLGALPISMMAQDDLYFVPSKESKMVDKKTSSYKDRPVYYVGSNRDIDEYNRRGRFRSSYQKIGTDSLGNDIIEFMPGEGVYPDTTYVDTLWVSPQANDFITGEDEYTYSRRMSRWDGWYGWYDPFLYRHWGYMGYGYYGWYDPWLYDAWYYGWYDPWYSPWYYGYGWYGYGYGYGWPYYRWYDVYYHPYYGGSYLAYTIGGSGTGSGSRNHGIPSYGASRGSFNGSSHTYANGTFGGSRVGSGSFGSRSTASSNTGTRVTTRGTTRVYSNSNGNFGGSSVNSSRSVSSSSSRSSSSSYTPAPSSSSSSSSYSGGGGGGGSFGGSRSGGGGGGGGRSGGGGFGGRR